MNCSFVLLRIYLALLRVMIDLVDKMGESNHFSFKTKIAKVELKRS